MKHKFHWLCGRFQLLLDELLTVIQNAGPQIDIAGPIYPMNVPEGCCDGEVRRDFVQHFIGLRNLFRLGIQAAAVDVSVVNSVFLATSDPKLNFEMHVNGRHAL